MFLQLVAEATPDHVDMAYKLFEASTMNAMNAGLISNTAGAAEEVSWQQGQTNDSSHMPHSLHGSIAMYEYNCLLWLLLYMQQVLQVIQ